MPRGTLDTSRLPQFTRTGLLPSPEAAFHLPSANFYNAYTGPQPHTVLLLHGLASSAFARHYLRNLC